MMLRTKVILGALAAVIIWSLVPDYKYYHYAGYFQRINTHTGEISAFYNGEWHKWVKEAK